MALELKSIQVNIVVDSRGAHRTLPLPPARFLPLSVVAVVVAVVVAAVAAVAAVAQQLQLD